MAEKHLSTEILSLVERVKSEDESAFAELCSMYEPLIRSMSSAFCGMTEQTDGAHGYEDFSQEAILALYRAAKTYEHGGGEVSFGLYAKICIRNALVSVTRRLAKKPKAEKSGGPELLSKLKRQSSRIPQGAGSIDIDAILGSDVLSTYEKTVFGMYADGVKIRDIAQALGRSSKSVSNAVFRIKAKLRESAADTN